MTVMIGAFLAIFVTCTTALRAPFTKGVTPITRLKYVKENILNTIDGAVDDVLVCPESLGDLVKTTRYYGFVEETSYTNKRFRTKYPSLPFRYIDLTIKSEVNRPLYTLSPKELIGQNLFQTRLLPSIYELGYRQNFATVGFPGAEKEFEEAQEFFQMSGAKRILDLSCGSGFMTRRFIKSRSYDRIYAADLSPTMLAETRRRIQFEGLKMPTLVRCDAARLPFRSDSLDAVHAGAAMHCW
jgi:2-polyprenyl-3-methyl-5-hydroxy-6-metoxy-1,4-benzoquinol methylase